MVVKAENNHCRNYYQFKNLMKSRVLTFIGPVLLIFLLSFPAYANLLRGGYFGTHDDVQIMRLFEMKKCLQDLQLPCRWVPDMGAGYGHPLFNYHPVLPYYFGMVFRLAGVSLVNTSKILFLLSLVLSGLFMYVLTREFFGKVAGTVAAVLFVYAPYHAVDVFVRGALSESWGMVFFPLVFWSLYKLVRENSDKYLVLSALSIAGLFLAHNVTALIFTPLALALAIFWMILAKKWHWRVVIAFVWAIGLSSFFVLPSLLETNLLNIAQVRGYFNFHDHFVYLEQLLWSRNWGYGPSIVGSRDDLSFQIGWPHWWLAIVALAVLIFAFSKSRRLSIPLSCALLAALLMVAAIWMSSGASVWVWEQVPLFSYVQFPWRWLAVVIFANALLVGCVVSRFYGRWQWLVAVVMIGTVIVMNASYFTFNRYYPTHTDQEMLSGGNWTRQSMTTLEDYVPEGVRSVPVRLAPNSPVIQEGLAVVSKFVLKTNAWSFGLDVSSPKALVSVPVFNFPVWQVTVDGKPAQIVSRDDGLITLDLSQGVHQVSGKFTNTPLRETANLISLLSLAVLMAGWFKTKIKTGRIKG